MTASKEMAGWHWFSEEVLTRTQDGARVAHRNNGWLITNRIGQVALGSNGKVAIFETPEAACAAVEQGRFCSDGRRLWLLPDPPAVGLRAARPRITEWSRFVV